MTSFTKSIKFKMAMWCSTLLLVFSLGFILIVNVFLAQYMRNNQPFKPILPYGTLIIKDLKTDEIEIIRRSRNNDLTNIRILSLYSIIPLTLLSFAGGYLIADKTLRPIEKLRDEMYKKQSKNLGEEIDYEDTEDEVSGLIQSFNSMSKRLARSFKAQKEFVENASHEIKTPLAIIQANLDTALMNKKIDNKELKSLLEESRKSVAFMNTLTEDLLLLSILDSEIEKSNINVCELFDEVRSQVNTLAKDKGIKIQIECDKPFEIKGNKIFLERAFINIIENSIKYSEGNVIRIKIQKDPKGVTQISIKDNGKGIPTKYANMVFERFYRVDKSRSRKSGGSGLGLAITKEIIEKHNGKIYLNTDNKQGAEFIVNI